MLSSKPPYGWRGGGTGGEHTHILTHIQEKKGVHLDTICCTTLYIISLHTHYLTIKLFNKTYSSSIGSCIYTIISYYSLHHFSEKLP